MNNYDKFAGDVYMELEMANQLDRKADTEEIVTITAVCGAVYTLICC